MFDTQYTIYIYVSKDDAESFFDNMPVLKGQELGYDQKSENTYRFYLFLGNSTYTSDTQDKIMSKYKTNFIRDIILVD